jgi:transposase-like protein
LRQRSQPIVSTRCSVALAVLREQSVSQIARRHKVHPNLVSTNGSGSLSRTRRQGNASKHKAMSHERMVEMERRLNQEIEKLLARAEQVDAEEDSRFSPREAGGRSAR